jgi:hypothetical protein
LIGRVSRFFDATVLFNHELRIVKLGTSSIFQKKIRALRNKRGDMLPGDNRKCNTHM